MTIRAATLNDIPALLALGRLLQSESPTFRGAGFDADKVAQTLGNVIAGGGVFVHETDGEIDGGFAGLIMERWFSRKRFACDLSLFVRPDRRGGIIACRLLDAFLRWTQAQGIAAHDVLLGVSTGIHADRTGALFERVGLERIGGIYRLKGY